MNIYSASTWQAPFCNSCNIQPKLMVAKQKYISRAERGLDFKHQEAKNRFSKALVSSHLSPIWFFPSVFVLATMGDSIWPAKFVYTNRMNNKMKKGGDRSSRRRLHHNFDNCQSDNEDTFHTKQDVRCDANFCYSEGIMC